MYVQIPDLVGLVYLYHLSGLLFVPPIGSPSQVSVPLFWGPPLYLILGPISVPPVSLFQVLEQVGPLHGFVLLLIQLQV